MMKLGNLMQRLLRDRRGTSSVEMGLILAMIVLAMFGALSNFADESVELWTTIKDRSVEATQGSTA